MFDTLVPLETGRLSPVDNGTTSVDNPAGDVDRSAMKVERKARTVGRTWMGEIG
jgi:hypothetical protein